MFGGDAGGNIVAFNATTGKPVWHSHIGNVTNPPITYMLDGRQHLLVAAGNMLYDFVLYDPPAATRGEVAASAVASGCPRLGVRASQPEAEATLLVLMQGVPQISSRGAGRREQAGHERDQPESQCGDAE